MVQTQTQIIQIPNQTQKVVFYKWIVDKVHDDLSYEIVMQAEKSIGLDRFADAEVKKMKVLYDNTYDFDDGTDYQFIQTRVERLAIQHGGEEYVVDVTMIYSFMSHYDVSQKTTIYDTHYVVLMTDPVKVSMDAEDWDENDIDNLDLVEHVKASFDVLGPG